MQDVLRKYLSALNANSLKTVVDSLLDHGHSSKKMSRLIRITLFIVLPRTPAHIIQNVNISVAVLHHGSLEMQTETVTGRFDIGNRQQGQKEEE